MNIEQNKDPRRIDKPFPILVAHQPEFLPWLGNISKAIMGDVYYVLDTVQFVKDVFQNRNKIRTHNGWQWLTVPVKKVNKHIVQWLDVEIDNNKPWKRKHLNAIKMSYGKAPYFDKYFPEIEELYNGFEGDKLIDLNLRILKYAHSKFNINVPIIRTSELRPLQGQKSDLILDMCRTCNAKTFVFGVMGKTYIEKDKFTEVEPVFQDFTHPVYNQIHGEFIPGMCFLDLLMNEGENSCNILGSSTYI